MSLLEIIYMAGIAAIFLIIGMVIEYFIDAQIIRETHQENQKLENEQLKQIKENPVLITEIVDNRVGADVDYSQNW
jgi:uncharacterized protein YneF (UPF0154 family)